MGGDDSQSNSVRDLSLDLQEHIQNEARGDSKYEAMVNLEYANRYERFLWGYVHLMAWNVWGMELLAENLNSDIALGQIYNRKRGWGHME